VAELPPPPPGIAPPVDVIVVHHQRVPRPGELVVAWRAALVGTWVLVFVAYLAVWKASEEIGIATWWLGPRSNPQPVIVRLVPFIVTATFGAIVTFPFRNLSWISLGGAAVLAAIAVPDFSRAAGLATIELIIAAAVAIVSLASLTGRYRAAPERAAPHDVTGG
jgi:hypothetical protein